MPQSYSKAVRERGRTDEFMPRPDRPPSPVLEDIRRLKREVLWTQAAFLAVIVSQVIEVLL